MSDFSKPVTSTFSNKFGHLRDNFYQFFMSKPVKERNTQPVKAGERCLMLLVRNVVRKSLTEWQTGSKV